jgi:hypothetical protein
MKIYNILEELVDLTIIENVKPLSYGLPKKLYKIFLSMWLKKEKQYISKMSKFEIIDRRIVRNYNEKTLIDLIIENRELSIEIAYLINQYKEEEELEQKRQELLMRLKEKEIEGV